MQKSNCCDDVNKSTIFGNSTLKALKIIGIFYGKKDQSFIKPCLEIQGQLLLSGKLMPSCAQRDRNENLDLSTR